MFIKRLSSFLKRNHKGQSFIELTLVFVLLLIILSGTVEFGILFNKYINLVDAARDGARYGSLADPFIRQPITNPDGTITCPNASTVFCVDQNFFVQVANVTKGSLSPIVLDPTTDDIVISFFSVVGSGPTVLRYPNGTYYSVYGNRGTSISTADIMGRLTTNAPNTGVLVVELYFNYHQALGFPFFTAFVPDPILVKTYAIMPLSAAEPTPTPLSP